MRRLSAHHMTSTVTTTETMDRISAFQLKRGYAKYGLLQCMNCGSWWYVSLQMFDITWHTVKVMNGDT